jgi:hypothetical protein
MAQHDYIIANGTGAAVRSDLNGSLAAIVSNNSGATEPTTMYAYQWWPDTTTGLLKIRNAANNAWITIGTLASANLGLLPLAGGTMTGVLAVTAGTAALPGIAVSGDLNTGLVSPGADQLAITTGGTSRLAVSTTAVSSTLPVDVPLGAVGTPSLTFTGDLNTGLFSSGADAIDIATAGTRRFGVSSAGELTVYGGNLTLNGQGDLRLADSDSSNYVALQAPATVASNVTFTLPSADGTNGQVLATNGTGTLSFTAAGGASNLADGTAATPSVNFSSDTDTGVFRAGANRLAFATNGASVGEFDGSDLKFNSGYGSVATAYGCRAWVNFNGTGTVAIRASGNVSSITDNGTGDYTVNFTTAMVDANYVTTGSCQRESGQPEGILTIYSVNSSGALISPTTAAARINTSVRSGGVIDSAFVCVAIFR